MRLVLLTLLLSGCIERQEIREQHCAQVAIERHGVKLCSGTYYVWVEGNRCYTRLWNQTTIYEGHLSDDWRPE